MLSRKDAKARKNPLRCRDFQEMKPKEAKVHPICIARNEQGGSLFLIRSVTATSCFGMALGHALRRRLYPDRGHGFVWESSGIGHFRPRASSKIVIRITAWYLCKAENNLVLGAGHLQ
jgi:hypothetical protein